jgi:hypothetical protein
MVTATTRLPNVVRLAIAVGVTWVLSGTLAVPASAQSAQQPPGVVGVQVDRALEMLATWDPGAAIVPDPSQLPASVSRDLVLVTDQEFIPGDPIEQIENAVRIELGVGVPDVVGTTSETAVEVLEERRLGFVVSPSEAGPNWLVSDQDPAAGTLVPFDASVDLLLSPPPPDVTLVEVPDLLGLTPQQAQTAVEAVGLALDLEPVGIGDRPDVVVGQDPEPNLAVAEGTTVTARIQMLPVAGGGTGEDGGQDGGGEVGGPGGTLGEQDAETPLALILALAVIMVVVALVAAVVRGARARRQRRWVRKHVRLLPGVDEPGDLETRDRDGPSVAIRLEPHRDPGSQRLEEVVR